MSNKEFKKIQSGGETRYVLETATGGATSAASIASSPEEVGEIIKRNMEDVDHPDHEVSMARSDLHQMIIQAARLQKLLSKISELEGLEGWQQAKLTKAADYIDAVYKNLNYEKNVSGADEGVAGGLAGGAIGAALTKTPSGAITGYKVGSAAQDMLSGDDDEEDLDELDAKTLAKYIPAATQTLGDLSQPDQERRSKSITRAVSKLVKQPNGQGELEKFRANRDGVAAAATEDHSTASSRGVMEDEYLRYLISKLEEINEGWKSKLAGLGLAGAMGLGGAHARVMPGQETDPGINRLTGKPIPAQVEPEKDSTQSDSKYRYTTGYDYGQPYTIKKDDREWKYGGKDIPSDANGESIFVPASLVGIRTIRPVKVILSNDGKFYLMGLDEDSNVINKEEKVRLDPKCWKGYHKQGTKMKGGVRVNNCVPNNEDTVENFADGKKPGRKGLAKRSGVDTKASVSDLRKTAKHSSGEKQRMAHWLANMKAGRAKSEDAYTEELEKKLAEKIPPGASVDYYIKDFSKSTAPQFRGKSQAKRREMAIAAHYAAQQPKKTKKRK